MNEALKLAVVFTTGVVVTFLLLGYVNKADAPSLEHTDTSPPPEADTTPDTTANTEERSVNREPQTYTPPSTPATAYPTNATVSFTGTEMVPKEVVIIEGGSVTFVNASVRDTMWIASHAHPLHNAYREQSDNDCAGSTFDQCRNAAPGGTWTFTFNLPGKWYYHEEGDNTATGLVTVLTKEQFDKRY